MTDVAPGIITNGLGGDQTAMIIGPFRLGFFEVEIIVPEPEEEKAAGGGPYPGDAWNKFDSAWDVYKPTDQQPYIPKGPKIPVTIRVRFQEKEIEKVYLVTPKHSKMLVRVLNVVNRTRDRMAITIRNLINRSSRIMTRVLNIRNKNENQ